MKENEAVEHLATIRRIMESAMQMTTFPGKAAICGGLLALAGCAVSWWKLGSLDFGVLAGMASKDRAVLIAMWAAVAVIGIGVDVLMTLRLARKQGRNAWPRLAQLAACAMGPGLLAAAVLTAALIAGGQWRLIAPTWMMLYGTAVWTAGTLSVRAPRALGLVFFLAGVVTLFWAAPVALATVALTFGLAHVVFGFYLIARFGD